MAAPKNSSNAGVQRRVNELLSELQEYISAGVISVNQVALILRQEGATISEPGTTENDHAAEEQPSVMEVNVSACSMHRFCILNALFPVSNFFRLALLYCV
jgi:hypothetical protein